MKRLILIPLLLLFALPAQAQELARMNPYILGAGVVATVACGATSEPAGSIFSEGFEGTGTGGYENDACGTAPCWTETSNPDQTYALSGLSGGTGDTKNC
jgi:hypothetical protein